jgi:hypothetical protein
MAAAVGIKSRCVILKSSPVRGFILVRVIGYIIKLGKSRLYDIYLRVAISVSRKGDPDLVGGPDRSNVTARAVG